jgi:hypothetical protein
MPLVGFQPTVQVFERAKTAVNIEPATAGSGVITAYFNLLSQLSREETGGEETFGADI